MQPNVLTETRPDSCRCAVGRETDDIVRTCRVDTVCEQRQIPVNHPAGNVVQDRSVDASTDKPQITNEALGVASVLGYRNSVPSKAIPSIEFMSKPGVPARFKPKLVRIAVGRAVT